MSIESSDLLFDIGMCILFRWVYSLSPRMRDAPFSIDIVLVISGRTNRHHDGNPMSPFPPFRVLLPPFKVANPCVKKGAKSNTRTSLIRLGWLFRRDKADGYTLWSQRLASSITGNSFKLSHRYHTSAPD
jgi:hypothetical protein